MHHPTPASQIGPRTHPALVIAALTAVGGLILAGFTGLGGEPFLSPYLDEIAIRTRSLGALAGYGAVIFSYGALSEGLLRAWVQRPATRRWGATVGALLPTVAVAVLHARYGWLQGLYGASIGLAAALCFQLCRRVLVLVVWHCLWDMAALGVVLVWAAYTPGVARDAMVFQHKMANVESGRLVHHPTRGWLDAAHYWETRTQLCRVYRHLSKHDAPAPITLTRTHASADGALRKLRVRYTFTPGVPASAAPWRAAGVALDIGLREERFQAAAHPLTGLAMSAFSFEDLPSAMAAALDVTAAGEIDAACAQRSDERIPDARADRDRWRREGRQLVGLRRDTVAPDEESPPAVHTLWRRMQAERETWRGETPAHP